MNVASEEPEEMVQVFMVVRCYSCKTFQVHQVSADSLLLFNKATTTSAPKVNKTNKWVCKICTEKQSVIKVKEFLKF